MALSLGWKVRQLDANNTFVNDYIMEEVYMTQPQSFEDPKNPSLVCRLYKSLYGLKQVPRAWF